ncbi:hypothetical protein B0A48_01807 [Cryoendolithus antarcticus]|uniref:Isochorismatase-like domain-containing protein n=1 Tax=Cryoendolithus antarcticus TaxID=1507870 RepID=A0A1V8TQP8_9PEZI|nr:hypothetical protein B0A48_01807 [Cryoendolithus antarcticus]
MEDSKQTHIGNATNFWLHSHESGYDLSRPSSSSSPSSRLQVATTTDQITVDPAKSALIVIDMQNFFLSPALGRGTDGAGHKAKDQLVKHAVPGARKAGVRVLWVNWGLTEKEVNEMPPGVKKAFGFPGKYKKAHEANKSAKHYNGLGSEMGTVQDPDTGKDIEAGKLLMRDQWNSALQPPLNELWEEGSKLSKLPDVWIHKNRMSALWGSDTDLELYLHKEGITTLFFTGVNTDQCVGGTLQDAYSKGYDCILLGDGCGTTSPVYAQQCMEYNGAGTWGFLATCEKFAEGCAKVQ